LDCKFWWNPGDFYVFALVDLDVIFFVPEVIGENYDGFDASPKTKSLSLITCCACIKNCPQNARSIKTGPVKGPS
jgi:hypothetical protein